jgi:hypothetical protein
MKKSLHFNAWKGSHGKVPDTIDLLNSTVIACVIKGADNFTSLIDRLSIPVALLVDMFSKSVSTSSSVISRKVNILSTLLM